MLTMVTPVAACRRGRRSRRLDVPGQAERLQRADAHPVEIDFVPREAVARAGRMGVMVVVPPFAERQQRDPPVVRRVVARVEPARSPLVGRRVHQPGGVQADGGAEEDAPEHVGNAAVGQQREADDDVRRPVPFGERDVDGIAHQIGHVPGEHGGVVVHALAGEDPAHVRPPRAFTRRVRIALAVGVLVMDAMRRHPEDRPAFERERPAPGQEVLDPLGRSCSRGASAGGGSPCRCRACRR